MRAVSLTPVLAMLGVPVAVAAAPLDDPRAVAMGGAVRGDPLHASALFYNPAGMARAYTYAAQGLYNRSGPGSLNVAGGAIVDSKTQPQLAVGAAYGYVFSDPDEELEVSGHDARLGFAHAVRENVAFVGMALRYLHYDRADPVEDTKGFTLDAGLLFSLSPSFHLGLTGRNLIDHDDPTFPREAGGGIAYTGGIFVLDFDTVFDFTTADKAKPVYSVGGEALVAETFPLRAGFEYNTALDAKFVGGGIGFMSSEAGASGTQLNIAFRQNLDETDQYQFVAGLTLFL